MKSDRATAEAEHRAHLESAEAWWGNAHLNYAMTAGGGGNRYHLVTCRMIQSAVRSADRGESRYPVRVSMDEINTRNLHPCGVCHGYDPLERTAP